MAFQRAQREANIVVDLAFDKHPLIISAMISSMIISYSKPFLQGTEKSNTTLMSQKYLTKNKDFDSNIHVAILEIRNNLVAHANRDYEKQEFRIVTASIESNVVNSKTKKVNLPMKFLTHSESLLNLNPKHLDEITNHLQVALDLTNKEISRNLILIRDLMLDFLDIADSIDEVVSLRGDELSSFDERILKSLVFDNVDAETKFKLGKNSVVIEHGYIAIDMPRSESFENDFYKITCIPNQETGLTNFQIQFKV
jgi:hypothetical protein